MTRSRLWMVALAIPVVVSGCQRESLSKRNTGGHGPTSSSVATSPSQRPPSPPAPPLPPTTVTSHPATPDELLSEWTRALNEADLAALGRLYSDRVQFYGVSLGRDQVVERKRQALAAVRTFQQTVLGKPSITREGDVTRIAFRKRSGPEDAQRDALATLVLVTEPPLVIREETDASTQKRYGTSSRPHQIPRDCASAAWQLVDSTAEAARLYEKILHHLKSAPAADLHQGGIGPFTPADTGDGTYSIAVGVHHPGRFQAYGWFTLHPNGKVTLYSWALDLTDAPVSPSSAALRHFKRLCPGK